MLLDMNGQELSDDFAAAWGVAKRHLAAVSQGSLVWLRATLHEPFITHLSFRLGNQVFFVFVTLEGGVAYELGTKTMFLQAADKAGAVACLFPMVKHDGDAEPVPNAPDWGLVDARTEAPVNPAALVTDALVELSEWEVHDYAVQVVCGQMRQQGYTVQSWHSYLGIHPTLWFEHEGLEHWVVVSAQRWPAREALRPKAVDDMTKRVPGTGHFASVVVAAGDQDVTSSLPAPLYRSQPLQVSYGGLEAL